MLKGLGVITKGESHKKNNTECQDFSELYTENKNYVMAAVADGHGSKKYYRSEKGSRFAAEAAKESIYEFMNDYQKFVESYKKDKDSLVDRIIKMTITKWHKKIELDLAQNHITQEEVDKYLGGSLNKDKIPSIYGTTLLAGVMSDECNFGFLIGDGSFVVIDKNGRATIPIEDANSKANYTTSLSSSDCINGFEKHFLDEKPFSMLLSTDGLIKSFANESDFLDYNQAICQELVNLDTSDKIIQMEAKLANLFEDRSKNGSEDDITIAIIFEYDIAKEIKEILDFRRKKNKIDEEIDTYISRLNSLNFKEKQLNDKRNSKFEELKSIQIERRNIDLRTKKLQDRRRELEEEIREIEKKQYYNDKKKIENDMEMEKCKESITASEYELKKNQEEMQSIEENIKIKREEKDKFK